MTVSGTQNVCQYWRADEPSVCGNWDITIPACTESDASFYPYCNLIGTLTGCSKYNGTGVQAMCVRPDPSRTVGNRRTGKDWVVLPTWSGAEIVEGGSFDAISEYHDGTCDHKGTSSKCTGYAPYILGFSVLQPDDGFGSQGIDDGDILTTISGFDLRLPLGFEIYNMRALLGRCYWWQNDAQDFTIPSSISGATPPSIVDKPLFLCTNPDEMVNEYSDFKWDVKLGMYRAPCNGAKPECPNYTSNVCWQYCVDEKMQDGDKVLAEQILELRYYIRDGQWDADAYTKAFKYPDIQAWTGGLTYNIDSQGNLKALIPAYRVSIPSFNYFNVTSTKATLIEGTKSEDNRSKYPDLVEELKKNNSLAPIIKNVFETASGTENIFEVPDINHEILPIFGDIFYYASDTYGINLKDPDLNLPSKMIEIFRDFDNMADAQARLKSFDDVYQNIECVLDFMMRAMPDKMVISTFGREENLFCIDMPTFFGDNEIVVLNKGSGRWEFDKISFKKIFCGGVIGQTSFSLVGQGEVNYLPDYASDLGAYNNNNGTIDFTFFPLVSSKTGSTSNLSYVYNDSVRKEISANPAYPLEHDIYDMSYKLYKINAFENGVILNITNMRFFGNSGYVLVTIPDEEKVLTRAVKPWEIDNDIYLTYPSGRKTLMEVFDEDNNHLEPNQIILRPKNVDDFRSPCSAVGIFMYIKTIYTYEKRSFNETPSAKNYEVVDEVFVSEEDVVNYRDVEIKSMSKNRYQLSKFGYEAMTIAAVFKGINGRIKGQTKTKMITWIRQPYCRDVEIRYSWTAGYTHSTLLPEYWCFGPTGLRSDVNTHYKSYSPLCGDHDLSFITNTGPMWYPYDDCDDTANYTIVSNLTEFDTGLMEVFKGDYPADPPHGSHDMRMLGPADNFGYTCDTHASIWACHCDWSFCNLERKTENIFGGYGRYRGGLSYTDKLKALQNEGSLPKFGNTYRDFLRSYRSMDNIDYYYWNGSSYMRKRKWVPMSEFYTSADLSLSAQDFPYLLYCSSDYYDDGAAFVHPMGLMLALDDIEGINIREKIDADSKGTPIRYHFEDIFNTHYTLTGVYYPYPKHVYYKNVGGVPTPIISWYTYKDYPGSTSSDVSTQWAWQEKWKKLIRGTTSLESLNCIDESSLTCCPNSNLLGKDFLFSDPYTGDSIATGKHVFLDIEYPEYRYDYMGGEHRLVAEEDEYDIIITPPTFTVSSGDSGLVIDEFFWAQMGEEGPYRSFDLNGSWDPAGCDKFNPGGSGNNEYYDLYTICTTTASGWVDDVTLFAPGYTDKSKEVAETEGRMVLTTDEVGDDVKTYYQRGLNVSFTPDNLDHLASKETLLKCNSYDMIFSSAPTFIVDDGDFTTVVPGDPYPGANVVDLSYIMGTGTEIAIEFVIRHDSDDFSEDSGIGPVSRIECDVEYGTSSDGNQQYLYYAPAVTVIEGTITKYECSTEVNKASGGLNTYRCSYSWPVLNSEIFDTKKTEADNRKSMLETGNTIETTDNIKIVFKLPPIQENTDTNTGKNKITPINVISIKNIYLYHTNFVTSKETVKVYERKYNISYGTHGDFPPHGRNNTGSLLYPLPTDASSIYQYDTRAGVVGLTGSSGDLQTMNKVRGRIMKECHDDKEPIEGPKNLDKWEVVQKKVYDDIAINSGETSFTLTASAPPSMESRLNEIGLSFPRWICTFTNTVVRPLKNVVQYSTYSPCGHRFKQDFEHMYYYPCGFAVAGVGRVGKDIFDYVYESACPQYSDSITTTQVGAVVAYYQGTARVLINPIEYAEDSLTHRDEIQQRIDASQQGTILMSFPEAVDSLN